MACGEAPRRRSGASSGACPGNRQPVRQMAMTRVITQQSVENMTYVRRLLREKQPVFSEALELALMLAELELTLHGVPVTGAER